MWRRFAIRFPVVFEWSCLLQAFVFGFTYGPWGRAVSIESWVQEFFDFSAYPERLFLLVAALSTALIVSYVKARGAAHQLALFVGATDEFETKGRATTSIPTLIGSLARSQSEWWRASKGVLNAIGRVLFYGYILPTAVLVCVMSLGAWLPCQAPLFAVRGFETKQQCGARLEDIGASAMFRQADAATVGALSGFDLVAPSVRVEPTGAAGRWIFFLLGAFTAVAGSLSLLQLIARWFGNLFRRWSFKFEKYAKRRQKLGLSESPDAHES